MSVLASAQAKARMRRGGFQPRAIAAIAVLWLLIWDSFSWGNLVNGLLVGLFVTVVLPLPVVPYSGRPHPWGLAVLAAIFLRDLVVSSLQITRLALMRKPVETGSIIEVPLRIHSDLYLTLTAILITLVPGSAVVEARRKAGVLYVHELGVHTAEQVEHARNEVLALERRIVRAIGSTQELAELDAQRERNAS